MMRDIDGGLCGSQQSTRSLTTDGAAFVVYEVAEALALQSRATRVNKIKNLLEN